MSLSIPTESPGKDPLRSSNSSCFLVFAFLILGCACLFLVLEERKLDPRPISLNFCQFTALKLLFLFILLSSAIINTPPSSPPLPSCSFDRRHSQSISSAAASVLSKDHSQWGYTASAQLPALPVTLGKFFPALRPCANSPPPCRPTPSLSSFICKMG